MYNNKTGRNIGEVIDEIMVVSSIEGMKRDLLKLKRDSALVAPENMYMAWEKAQEILMDYIPDPLESEENNRVFKIFVNVE